MEAAWLVAMRQAALHRNSRRALVALAGGLAAAGTLPLDDVADARKKGRRKKRKNRRKDRKGPKVQVTATCPVSDSLGTGANDGDSRVAQTFVASRSGLLVNARLPITKDLGGSGDIELRLSPVDASGIPTNEVLAVSAVTGEEVPDDGADIDFAFSTPFSVEAGDEYALVLTRPGGDGFGWFGEDGNPCSGRSFFSSDQTSPFASSGEILDLAFTAFVSP
jgi:hypothetical protein